MKGPCERILFYSPQMSLVYIDETDILTCVCQFRIILRLSTVISGRIFSILRQMALI
jgi:hypothetical protein